MCGVELMGGHEQTHPPMVMNNTLSWTSRIKFVHHLPWEQRIDRQQSINCVKGFVESCWIVLSLNPFTHNKGKMKFSLIGLLTLSSPSLTWSLTVPKIQQHTRSPTTITTLFSAEGSGEEKVLNKWSRCVTWTFDPCPLFLSEILTILDFLHVRPSM